LKRNDLTQGLISDTQITQGLVPYGVTPDNRLRDQVRDYISLLRLWNQKVSLTAVKRPEDILQFHFGESFLAVKQVPIENGRLADVGSGAGFPAIPIAMLVPDLEVTLIEANLKKTTFLSEVIRRLALRNTRVVRSRMDDVEEDSFNFVTARALAPHQHLTRWSARSLAPSGKLVLWVGEADAAVIAHESGWVWQNPIQIPGSRRRVLLIGTSEGKTN